MIYTFFGLNSSMLRSYINTGLNSTVWYGSSPPARSSHKQFRVKSLIDSVEESANTYSLVDASATWCAIWRTSCIILASMYFVSAIWALPVVLGWIRKHCCSMAPFLYLCSPGGCASFQGRRPLCFCRRFTNQSQGQLCSITKQHVY